MVFILTYIASQGVEETLQETRGVYWKSNFRTIRNFL